MATPVYIGGGYRRGRGDGRDWRLTSGPTDLGWFERVGSWFRGTTPRYAGAGQPASGAARCGMPVYLPAPPST